MSYKYLIFDLPSDHEIEDSLATECDVIRAVVANEGRGGNVKVVRATTRDALDDKALGQPYKHVAFVHLSCHGNTEGVAFLGDRLSWKKFAGKLKAYLPELEKGQDRVLCLSCCFSRDGLRKMKQALGKHITGYYYFEKNKIGFAETIACWSVFYLRKNPERPRHKMSAGGASESVDSTKVINNIVPGVKFHHRRTT